MSSNRPGENRRPQVVAVVGCQSGDGASTIALHLAAALASRVGAHSETGVVDRVLLIDANLGNATIHKLAAQSRSPGLGNWLSQKLGNAEALSELVRESALAHLDILSAGSPKDVEALPRCFGQIVGFAQKHYRHVVIDLPPLFEDESAARLSGMCDASLIVVQAGKTRTETVRRAITRLGEHRAPVVGIVLNKHQNQVPDWLDYRS
jgi:Mrp family chromosome partitioning ATPase